MGREIGAIETPKYCRTCRLFQVEMTWAGAVEEVNIREHKLLGSRPLRRI
jgi:hypothetical protein